LVAVAFFIPGRAKDLSAPPRRRSRGATPLVLHLGTYVSELSGQPHALAG